jgi:hypothetical protein
MIGLSIEALEAALTAAKDTGLTEIFLCDIGGGVYVYRPLE